MRYSVMVEGQNGLNWQRWKSVVDACESLGFHGLYRSDHFTNAGPPDKDSLELWVSLTYLATTTNRLVFGQLVSPFSFRHPVFLARQAAALNDLSGGRMILGVGAGWQEREHQMFGFELGDVPTRATRMEEGLEVVAGLLSSNEPFSYRGHFYRIEDARLLPRPSSPVALCVGGNGPRRTIPLVARYADVWNASFIDPDTVAERNQQIDEVARSLGREPTAIHRSLMTWTLFAKDESAVLEKLKPYRQSPAFEDKSDEQILNSIEERGGLAGTPDRIKARLKEYETAGIQEVSFQWLDLDDLDGLENVAAAFL